MRTEERDQELREQAWKRTMEILNQPQEPGVIERMLVRLLVVTGVSAFALFYILLITDILKT